MQNTLIVVALAALAAAWVPLQPTNKDADYPAKLIAQSVKFTSPDKLQIGVAVPYVQGRDSIHVYAGTCEFSLPAQNITDASSYYRYLESFEWSDLTSAVCNCAVRANAPTDLTKDEFRGLVTVKYVENLPMTTEGVIFTRTVSQDLTFTVIFNRIISANTTVKLYSEPIVREALTSVTLDIHYPLVINQGSLLSTIKFGLKDPFILSLDSSVAKPIETLLPNNLDISKLPVGPVNTDAGAYLIQAWDIEYFAACCTFQGVVFRAHLVMDCQPGTPALDCPIHEKKSMYVDFSVDTTPFCPAIEITVSASMSLATYKSDYVTALDSYFLDSEIYAKAQITSNEVSITGHKLLFVGVAGEAIVGHNVVPADDKDVDSSAWLALYSDASLGSPLDLLTSDSADGANAHRIQFKASTQSPAWFACPYNEFRTFTIYARVQVNYRGNAKRQAPQSLTVGIRKEVTLGNTQRIVASAADALLPFF